MAKLGSPGAGITTELHWAAYAAAQVQIPKPNSLSAFCFNDWEMYSISLCPLESWAGRRQQIPSSSS